MPRDMCLNLYQGIVTTDFLDEEIRSSHADRFVPSSNRNQHNACLIWAGASSYIWTVYVAARARSLDALNRGARQALSDNCSEFGREEYIHQAAGITLFGRRKDIRELQGNTSFPGCPANLPRIHAYERSPLLCIGSSPIPRTRCHNWNINHSHPNETQYIRKHAPTIIPSDLNIHLDWPSPVMPGTEVSVSARYRNIKDSFSETPYIKQCSRSLISLSSLKQHGRITIPDHSSSHSDTSDSTPKVNKRRR
jgi:hypothetical protein